MKNQSNQTAPFGHYKLFTPAKLGPYELNHRVALAPMTRLRADAIDAPSEMMVKFYGQRSSEGGFLIAEGTSVSITGRSYYGAPGIYADEQIPAWKKLTKAVHQKGGRICILWR